ncbi:MAG: tail fiber domain-containing protein [Planctomycetes bacterium]|nr:tail fiber domain-containing protein [Planctomycetota bacterium]
MLCTLWITASLYVSHSNSNLLPYVTSNASSDPITALHGVAKPDDGDDGSTYAPTPAGSGNCMTRIRDITTGSCIGVSTDPTLGMLYPLSSTFSISGSNVGINTAFPIEPLDISLGDKSLQIRRDGNLVPGINLTGTGGNVGILRLRNSLEIWPDDTQARAGYLDVRGFDGAPRCSIRGDSGDAWFLGNVGIGTSSPVNTLDVAGGVNIDSADSNTGGITGSLRFGGGGSGEGILSKRDAGGNQYGLDFFTGTSVRMTVTQVGDVGIGRFPSSNRLEVEGEASKSTAGLWLANSDRRIKTDVRSIEGALATLDRLRPVAFHYTDEYVEHHPTIENKEYYNVIAQEFAEVFPDYVKDSGENGILQVDTYPALIHAIAAVKELHGIVARQDETLRTLTAEKERQITELQERLERLESTVAKLAPKSAR